MTFFFVVLYSENRILDFLSIDGGFFMHSEVFIGFENFLVDFKGNGSVVEDKIFGHDSEGTIKSDELVGFVLLELVEIGCFFCVYEMIDGDI